MIGWMENNITGVKAAMSLGSILSVELYPTFRPEANKLLSELESRIESRIHVDKTTTSLGYDGGTTSVGSVSGNTGTSASANAGAGGTNRASAGGGTGGSGDNNNARYYNNQSSTVVVNLLRQNHIYARPLGNVIYMMPSLITPPGRLTPSPPSLPSFAVHKR